MELQTTPPLIHTVYNPVVFVLGTTDTTKSYDKIAIQVKDSDDLYPLEVALYNQSADPLVKTAYVDLRLLLSSHFHKKLSLEQSFIYRVLFDYAGETEDDAGNKQPIYAQESGEFTAVRSVVQIGDSPDLKHKMHKLLTPFNRLRVYNGYPADVSLLANKRTQCVTAIQEFTFTQNQVARIPLACNTQYIKTDSDYLYIARWNENSFVCRQAIAGNPDPLDFKQHYQEGYYNSSIEYNGRMYLTSDANNKKGIYYLDKSGSFYPTNITTARIIGSCIHKGVLYFISRESGYSDLYYLDTADDTIKLYNSSPFYLISFRTIKSFNNKLYISSDTNLFEMDETGELKSIELRSGNLLAVINNRLYMGGLAYLAADNTITDIIQEEILFGFTYLHHNGKHYFIKQAGPAKIYELSADGNSLITLFEDDNYSLQYSGSLKGVFYIGGAKNDIKGTFRFNPQTKQLNAIEELHEKMVATFIEFNGMAYFGTISGGQLGGGSGIWYLDETDGKIKPTKLFYNYAYSSFIFSNSLFFYSNYVTSVFYLAQKLYYTGSEAATLLDVGKYETEDGEPVSVSAYNLLDYFRINNTDYPELTQRQFSLLSDEKLAGRTSAFLAYVEQREQHNPITPENEQLNQNDEKCIIQHIKLDGQSSLYKTISYDGETGITFTVDATDDWKAYDVPEWISLSVTQAYEGQTIITLQVNKNETTVQRTAKIPFRLDYYDRSAMLEITQDAEQLTGEAQLDLWLRNMGTMQTCKMQVSAASYPVTTYDLTRGEVKEFTFPQPLTYPYNVELKAIGYEDDYGVWKEGGILSIGVTGNYEIVENDDHYRYLIRIKDAYARIQVTYDAINE